MVIYFVSDIGTYHPMNVLTCCGILPILAWSTGDLIQWYVFPKLILDMYVISCFYIQLYNVNIWSQLATHSATCVDEDILLLFPVGS